MGWETREFVFGISKDILKNKYAPNIDYADFVMCESKDKKYIYCIQYINGTGLMSILFGNKKVKILAKITKEEFILV